MKKLTTILIAFSMIMLFAGSTVFAQGSATASTTAKIVGACSVSEVTNLNFGNIVSGGIGAPDSIKLNPHTQLRTVLVGNAVLAGGTVTAAKFQASGDAGLNYNVTFTLTNFNIFAGGLFMKVYNFTTYSASGYTLTGGTDNFFVGATLDVAAQQGSGTYTDGSSLDVTVNYQ